MNAVPPELIQRVEDVTLDTYLRAQEIYGRTFDLATLEYNLRGRVAGRAWWPQNRIQLNPVFLLDQADFIHTTVPHEIAHLLTHALHGSRARPHGPEWRQVMLNLGHPPIRCHNYDVTNVSTRPQRRWRYACACNQHLLSTTLHRKILRGQWRQCVRCRKTLRRWALISPAGQQTDASLSLSAEGALVPQLIL